jgi:segregation and condensation protein A
MPVTGTANGGRDGRAILAGAFPIPGAAPQVLFGRHRNESSTHIRWEEFEGPLALLLALIEARQFDVLTVPLGGLAEAYLDALASLPGDRLGNVSGFVAVAAQLILIKSQAILPRPPKMNPVPLDGEPDPEAELRARLIEYRRFRDAGLALGERYGRGRLYRRDAEVATSAGRAGARPPERPPLPASTLPAALRRLARVVPVMPIPSEVLLRSVTMAERTAVIRAALRGADVVVLQDLLGSVRDRVVVVVTFLAMLELCKLREITLEQAEPWGPIIARKRIVSVEPGSAADEDDVDLDEGRESDE